ncbi:hypothetical protein PUN28_003396 [Cardiocondyla obscurior]|uniref:Uncharacterized protein n=1 Tax=Cardiocondyla obscurior TaxID=286306 RepID=A0AAW2GJF1_9HYME
MESIFSPSKRFPIDHERCELIFNFCTRNNVAKNYENIMRIQLYNKSGRVLAAESAMRLN